MNTYTAQRIEQIKQKGGYDLSFDTVFTEIFKLYGQSWWQFGLFYIMIFLFLCCGIFGFITLFSAYNFSLDNLDVNAIENYSAKIGVAQVFFGTIVAVVFAPLNVGFFKVLQDLKYEGEFRFQNFFYFYTHRSMLKIMLVGLVVGLFNNTVNYAILSLNIGETVTQLFSILVSLLVFYYTFFVYPLIIFGEASINKAFEISFWLLPMQFLTLFAITICTLLLAISGLLAFCIGILFTVSFMYIGYFVIYDQVIGTDPNLYKEEVQQPVEPVTPISPIDPIEEVYTKEDTTENPHQAYMPKSTVQETTAVEQHEESLPEPTQEVYTKTTLVEEDTLQEELPQASTTEDASIDTPQNETPQADSKEQKPE